MSRGEGLSKTHKQKRSSRRKTTADRSQQKNKEITNGCRNETSNTSKGGRHRAIEPVRVCRRGDIKGVKESAKSTHRREGSEASYNTDKYTR